MDTSLHRIVADQARLICRQVKTGTDVACDDCCELVADIGFNFLCKAPRHVRRMKQEQMRAAFQSACYNA